MRLQSIVHSARFFRAPLVFLCLLIAFAGSVAASPLPIQDASFDERALSVGSSSAAITPWREVGRENTNGFIEHVQGFAADGQNHLGMNTGHDVWQDLDAVFEPHMRYTLTVAVGRRSGQTLTGNQSQYLLADSTGTVFASETYDANRMPLGVFRDVPPLVFETGADSPAIGKTIRILLQARGAGRSHFDKIRLTAATTLLPVATTLPATEIADRSAIVNGEVNTIGADALITFEFGPTTEYGGTLSITPHKFSSSTDTPVATTLHGLAPDTTYHYRIVASSQGGTTHGADQTFTTAPALDLSGLTASEGSLTPAFAADMTAYDLQVASSTTSIRVTPETDDPSATISVQGVQVDSGSASHPLPLAIGNTVITITLSRPGTAFGKTYEITVTRPTELFAFAAADTPAVRAGAFDATGLSIDLSLGFAPDPGTNLVVIDATGLDFIRGEFANLGHGENVILEHDGYFYPFVANYFGGTGNDLTLEWANRRLFSWGRNQRGQLGTGDILDSTVPIAAENSGVLQGKTIVAATAGEDFSVALGVNGPLVSWGANAQYGELGNNRGAQSPVPVEVENSGVLAGKRVIAIATGVYHSLALCADGTLVSWGRNHLGQLGAGPAFNQDYSRVPVMVDRSGVLAGKTVVAVAAGLDHSVVLCSDGTLAAWGGNGQEQLGDGALANSPVPVLVRQPTFAAGKKAVRIAAGHSFSLVLYDDGILAAWGSNIAGQLGVGTTSPGSGMVQTSANGELAGRQVIDIAAGFRHAIALCSDGTLAAWGYNFSGQLGNNSTINSSVPIAVDRSGALAGKIVTKLAAGSSHSLVRCADGTMAAWGRNASGQLGNNSTSTSLVPVAVETSALIPGARFSSVIAGGSNHSVAVVASPVPAVAETLAATEIGDTRATLNASVFPNGMPTTVSFEYGLTTDYGLTVAAATIDGTGLFAAAVTPEGLLTNTTYHFRVVATNANGVWRGNGMTFTTGGFSALAGLTSSAGDMIPDYTPIETSYAVAVLNPTDHITVTPVAAFPGGSITVNGLPVVSGAASQPIGLAEGDNEVSIVVTAADGINSQTYTVIVTRIPQRLRFDSPGVVPLNVSSLQASGSMIGFDLAHHPQVGTDLMAIRQAGLAPINGEFENLSQAQPIILSHEGIDYEFVADYFGGSGNDLVLRWANTRLFAWGAPQNGRLGISSSTFVSVPTPVNASELLNGHAIKAVSAGNLFTMVLRVDGVVVGFGSNGHGQLGNASVPWQTDQAVEVDRSGVLAGRTVVAVSTGSGHTLALCSDGTVAAWGVGSSGQLGNNSTNQSSLPVEVDRTGALAGRRIVAIAAGSSHSLALCRDGRLFTWGSNASGQLGNGSLTNSPVPVEVNMGGVLAGKRVTAIAAGNSHSLVLSEDGTLATWGSNSDGQLGNNDELDSSLPVRVYQSGVLAGRSVAMITAGSRHNFALCSDGTLIAWGSGANGALGDGMGSLTNHSSRVPVAVPAAGALAGREIVAAVGGISYSLALCSDGSASGWGGGASGQLGDGLRGFSNPVPVEVSQVNLAPGERFLRLASGPSSYHSLGIVGSPPPPAATTLAATGVRDKGATLRGTVLASGSETSVRFEFGPTPEYGEFFDASPSTVSGVDPVEVRFEMAGLVPGRIYHYRVVASGPGGTIFGEDVAFTTTTLATLAGLSVGEAPLSPSFDPVRTHYITTVPFGIEGVSVTALASHSEAGLRVNGTAATSGEPGPPLPLAVGINTITVDVTSGDGQNKTTYHISVTRMPGEIRWVDAGGDPVEADGFLAAGNTPPLALGHAPQVGTSLMLVNNTGHEPISGTFANLEQGRQVLLEFDGIAYPFFANYFGGDGNDLTLDWANTRVFSWGAGSNGRLGNGENTNQWLPTPVDETGILAGKSILGVAAGHAYSVALSADGTLAAWGDIGSGLFSWDFLDGVSRPVEVALDEEYLAGKTVIALAAGNSHILALCSDGTVVELGMESRVMNTGALTGKRVIAIAAGTNGLSIALCSDGTLATWGANNGSGQLGNGTTTASSVPVAVDMTGVLAGKRVVKVAAGAHHCLALCSDGTLVAWGSNTFGSLGIGASSWESRPVLVDRSGALAGKTITGIAAGRYHSLACCSDGTVAAWGWNMYGQLGDGSTTHRSTAVAVIQSGALHGKTVTSVFAGEVHSMAMCSDGTIISWGGNGEGQLGNNGSTDSTVPVIVDTSQLRPGEQFTARSQVSTYGFHNLAIAAAPPGPLATALEAAYIDGVGVVLGGEVWPNGSPTSVRFEVGLNDSYGTTLEAVPAIVEGRGSRAVEVVVRDLQPDTTYQYRVGVDNEFGTHWSAGRVFTTLSDNARLERITSRISMGSAFDPDKLDYFGTVGFERESVELRPRTEHRSATVEVNGQPLTAGVSPPIPLQVGNNPITIVVTAEDRVTARTYTIIVTRLPEEFVLDGSGVAPVSANGFRPTDRVPALRLNFHPPAGASLTLVENTSLLPISSRFTNLAQGQRVTLSFDGETYDFVANYYGGSGNDLVLQWANTAALAWGLNSHGQLGDGSATNGALPVMVDLHEGVLAGKTLFALSAGYLHSLALFHDGTLASWGYNVQGQLGLGHTEHSHLPQQVSAAGALAGKTVVAIAAGAFHNLALCDDGTLVSWGMNNHGQLGTGDRDARPSPTLVEPLGALAGKRVVAIAAGSYHSLALCDDGTVAAWGYNDEGELGDGTTATALVPVALDVSGALAGKLVARISTGQYHTLALCTDGTLVAWGWNGRGQLGDGTTTDRHAPVTLALAGEFAGKPITAPSAGGMHSLLRFEDGSFAGWGDNSRGQLITDGAPRYETAQPLEGTALELNAGAYHSVVRRTSQSIDARGDPRAASTPLVTASADGIAEGARFVSAATGAAAFHSLAIIGLPNHVIGLADWRVKHFGTAANEGEAADCHDCLHDGIPNLVKYAFGLDPWQHSTGKIPQPKRVGDALELRFTRPAGVADIEYGAEWSPDLSPGSWQDVPDSGEGDDHLFSLPLDTAPSLFMRLRVSEKFPTAGGGGRQRD